MGHYINQYKLFFVLLWIVSYCIYPSWALPVSITLRYVIFFGLLTYFLFSLHFLTAWFKALHLDKPCIVKTENFLSLVRKNKWLSLICAAAFILHIHPIITRPILIIGDEALHIQGGLWIYNYIDSELHNYIRAVFWLLSGLVLVLTKRGTFRRLFSGGTAHALSVNSLIAALFGGSVIYFMILSDLPFYHEIVRYPPLSRWLYFILYSAFGIDAIWPRLLQLVFYVMSAVYLYRTVRIFSDDRAALLGALIYLFFPVTYIYAGLAEVGCGTVFFIILISFHFLRYLKEKDDRDLILVSLFTGAGFMYKRSIFVMVFVCAVYLILSWLKNRDGDLLTPLKVILLSLVPILPWMIIGKFFTWRNYTIVWSNFIPPDGKVFSYFTHLPSDISWILFSLFLISLYFVLRHMRSHLSLYLMVLFITFYFFFAIDMAGLSPRLSMAFYPTIAIVSALFLSAAVIKIKWKFTFPAVFVTVLVYGMAICALPSLRSAYLQSIEFGKLQNYPTEEAMRWVKDNVKDGERIMTLRIMTARFYRDKYKIGKDKIVDFWFELGDVSTPDKMGTFIRGNNISYVMFPYGPRYPRSQHLPVLQKLKENNNGQFYEVARFNLDDNYVYIYRPQ